MKRGKLKPMTHDELEALPAKRPLAKLKCLHQCENSLALSDQEIENYEPSGLIEFKESSIWIAEYNNLKEILSQREHIPQKREIKGRRTDLMKNKGNS